MDPGVWFLVAHAAGYQYIGMKIVEEIVSPLCQK
jgi:hypothetical protein